MTEHTAALILQGQLVKLVRELTEGMPAEHRLELSKSLVDSALALTDRSSVWPLLRADMKEIWKFVDPEDEKRLTDALVTEALRALKDRSGWGIEQAVREFLQAATEHFAATVADRVTVARGLDALAPKAG